MILLRHGQSEFNLHFTVSRQDPGIPDPPLTPLGHTQAREAAEALRQERIRRIVVSPYTRTLQTADAVARVLEVPVFVNPIVRERYGFSCDIGSPCTELMLTWPQHDFSAIPEIWWPPAAESAESILQRAALFRAEMAALPDWSDTLVVSHWGFILSMTGIRVVNGEWLRCDPTAAPPEEILWRPLKE